MIWNTQWKSVIFDFDGTLLDSLGFWNQLDVIILQQYGITAPADISEQVKKMTVPEAAAYYTERFHLDLSPQELNAEIDRHAARAYRDTLLLKDGAREFLGSLQQRHIPAALATVTAGHLLLPALERLSIRQYFRHIVTAEKFANGKRSPEIYLHTANLLGTAPAETLVIEDALHAAHTAKAAGFPVLGILDETERSDWEAIRQTADAVITSWQEISLTQ